MRRSASSLALIAIVACAAQSREMRIEDARAILLTLDDTVTDYVEVQAARAQSMNDADRDALAAHVESVARRWDAIVSKALAVMASDNPSMRTVVYWMDRAREFVARLEHE